MPLIEGVGDEVVEFVVALLAAAVAALAWWSTNARPNRYRTVLVMRSQPHHSVTVNIRTRPHTLISNSRIDRSDQVLGDMGSEGTAVQSVMEQTNSHAVIPVQEMDSIEDADITMMGENRLRFYRMVDTATNTQIRADSSGDEVDTREEPEPASVTQMREMDSIVNAMEADTNADCDLLNRASAISSSFSTQRETSSEKEGSADTSASSTRGNANSEQYLGDSDNSESATDSNKIIIKLKFLNDTLKEVEGSLDEPLKDFKWRHFSAELSSECRVRLIFNGRVLTDEAASLRACGLHHLAVVHCLVHPARRDLRNTSARHRVMPDENPIRTDHEVITEGIPQERQWDLENILMTLVSVALTVVWFFRCEYSNMFTASASVALFGLTAFYTVAIFGMYLSDAFHFDRRSQQTQPQHPNTPERPYIAGPPFYNN